MAQSLHDNLHSRLVAILKIALPLLALAILSTLFLFSRTIDPEDAIPYADVDVADRLREPRMTNAGFAGMTPDGSSIAIAAAEAKPGADQSAKLRLVIGSLQTPDGAKTDLAATAVQLNTSEKRVELTDGAELRSSTGYVVSAQGLDIATDRTFVETRGEVSAQGPMGQLTAQHMQLTRAGQTSGPYLLVFNGKVRLLYQPDR